MSNRGGFLHGVKASRKARKKEMQPTEDTVPAGHCPCAFLYGDHPRAPAVYVKREQRRDLRGEVADLRRPKEYRESESTDLPDKYRRIYRICRAHQIRAGQAGRKGFRGLRQAAVLVLKF